MELLAQTELDSIARLSRRWGLPEHDILLCGDGSGSGWDRPLGWCCVLLDRRVGKRRAFFGGASSGSGSVSLAELLPFILAINFVQERKERGGSPHDDGRIIRILILSDNASLVREGNAVFRREKDAASIRCNRPFWLALLGYERLGYAVQFIWKARISSALNGYADAQGRLAYRAIRDLPRPRTRSGREVSIYDCNAEDDRPTPLHAEPRRPEARRRKTPADPPCCDPEGA